MKLQIAAVGLLKSGPEKALALDYETRTQGLCRQAGFTSLSTQEWSESKLSDPRQRLTEEAKQLWSVVQDDGSVFALDERGKAVSSLDFAGLLQAEAQGGTRQLTFLIGGPDGHLLETRQKAKRLLAFGPMTWPHRLVRIMLLEQIYRAVTILVNHPYHRG